MKIKTMLLAALMAALSGCATERGFRQAADRTIGMNINAVISKIGPPTSTYTMPNGNVIYTFARSRSGVLPIYRTPIYTSPSTTTYSAMGNMVYATTSPGMVTGGQIIGGTPYANSCRLDLTVDTSNVVRSYRYEGNACKERER